MLKKIGRLFIIKTRFEACLIIYALAAGAMARGTAYLHEFPGYGGQLLLVARLGGRNHFWLGCHFRCDTRDRLRRRRALGRRRCG